MSSWKITLPTKMGNTCGTIPNRTTLSRLAPVASIASIGPRSTFSSASAVVFDRKPMERQASASIPGKAPSPSAATNRRAKISSWTDRDRTMIARPTA